MSHRVLGVDYGMKRIGIAISDPFRIIAQQVTTLTVPNLKQAAIEVESLRKSYSAMEIIIGMPLTLKGVKGEAAQAVEKFILELRKQTSVQIISVDERFTSVIARRTLVEMGKTPSKNKEMVDRMSAALILQTYLDSSGGQVC